MARADADDFAAAVLDFSLGSASVTPFARRLARRNVPFILHTGMSRSDPSLMEWRDSLIVEKPASPHTLAVAIKSALRREPVRRQSRR
jgi:DNA-binding response OmpR family regulator